MENAILIVFTGTALTAGYLTFHFFRREATGPKRPLTWRRWAVGNVLILLCLTTLFLTSGEIYYRYFYDSTESYALCKTTVRWGRRHYQLNQSGMRDSFPAYLKNIPAGMRRISFFGDSFTAGHGVANVEDRFANQIRNRHVDWEIHVWAKNGWDTGDQLAALEQGLPADYELDVVVLVYLLNDISDLAPDYWNNAMRRVTQHWRPPPFLNESYFLNTWYYRLRSALDPDLGDYFHYVEQWYRGPLWDTQATRLRELHDAVTRRGGRLLVVTFPFLQTAGAAYPFRDIHAQLAELWSSLDVPYLDLSETLFTVPSQRLVVNRFDAHPNELAHAMAADAIEAFIQENLKDP